MYDMPGYYAPVMDRSMMLDHYCRMYPPVAMAFFPHVHAVAAEMDDPSSPLLSRERFDAMVDRVMSRMDAGWWMDEDENFDFDFDRRDRDRERERDREHERERERHRRFRFPRRRELAHGLISGLLMGEIMRRRRFFSI